MKRVQTAALVLLAAACAATPALAEDGRPPALREVGFDQRLGQPLPLDATFRDESGRAVRLGDYFQGRPVVLTLNYYECPMLCTVVLNGLAGALDTLAFDPGREFEVVTVSFDPKEGPALAAAKKKAYLQRYHRPGAAQGWHFLTGDEASIRRLSEATGFRYAWDAETRQWAHAAGIMVATPDGRLSHYLYGVEYAPKDLRLALVEASGNRIGNAVDQVLLFCYHYDPATGKYGPVVMGMVRGAGVLTLVALVSFIFAMWRREHAAQRTA